MTIPVVQGTAVPVGSTPVSSETAYRVAPNGETETAQLQDNRGPPQFQDVPWAVLFVAHLAVMISLIAMNFSFGNGDTNVNGIVWLVGITAAVSTAISMGSLQWMMAYPTALVKVSLVLSVTMSLLVALLSFATGNFWMGLLCLFFFAIGVCYARAVWERIPFAAANLKTALTAVRSNMGLTVVAILMMIVAIGWSFLWFVGLATAMDSNGAIVFLLLLSYYWVHQVLSNVVHVTSAGTVATWWHVPLEASSCWSPAIQDSFRRATTYSFGSICLGSLLVAIVQALRALAHMSRNNDDMQLLTCILDCILALIQDIIEYLNKWAYVYVGIYGFPYMEAGRNVIQLFEQKGWTVIISDDLCDRVLFMVSLGVGFLTGLVGWAVTAADPNLVQALGWEDSAGVAGFVTGLIVGFVFCSILLSVVGSAVNTVIVCYAESPAEFQNNHPELSTEMRASWVQAWPGLIN